MVFLFLYKNDVYIILIYIQNVHIPNYFCLLKNTGLLFHPGRSQHVSVLAHEYLLHSHAAVQRSAKRNPARGLFPYFCIYLFTWYVGSLVATRELLVAARRIYLPDQGWNPGPPALGARSLSHWTTREFCTHPLLHKVQMDV